jgi:transposase
LCKFECRNFLKKTFVSMQMQLPLFPKQTKLVNATVGIFEKEDFVYYLHNGSPVFCHHKDDLNNYRYIVAQMVFARLCKCSEIAKALGVSSRNIQRYCKALREKGSDWFFNRPERRGTCYKLNEDSLAKAQQMLDDFFTVSETAKALGVSEGALRYHMRNGRIKKKLLPT